MQKNKKNSPFRLYIGVDIRGSSSLRSAFDTQIRQNEFDFLISEMSHPFNYLGLNPSDTLMRRAEPFTQWDIKLRDQEYRKLTGRIPQTFLDLDSEDIPDFVVERSRNLLMHHFQFACHIGYNAILLPRMQSSRPKNLVSFLQEIKPSYLNNEIQIILPVRFNSQADWEAWKYICNELNHDTRRLGLFVIIPSTLSDDYKFYLDRLLGDKVRCIVLETKIFIEEKNGPRLAKKHETVVKRFMREEVSLVLKPSASASNFDFIPFFEYLENLFENHHQYSQEDRSEYNYWDYLQNPLQPLAQNLENAVYETLQFDSPKYKMYEAAFYKAMCDFKKLGGKFNQLKTFQDEFPQLGAPSPQKQKVTGPVSDTCIVMVLGAGRGPIVDRALKAAKEAGVKVKVYAVEKNLHAVNTLRNRMLENAWRGRVDIVLSDMRDWKPTEKADIIASELLGSFGDNQLSPQCLDPTQPFLKPTGIYIPFRYLSYAQPISSQRLWEKASQQKVDQSVANTLELGYVVRLSSYSLLGGKPEPCFQFHHPRKIESNDMFKTLVFTHHQKLKKEIHGFAGFFQAQLYQDVVCSILPLTHTPRMRSWFPIYFPIREPMIIEGGEKIELSIWRKSDMEQVWYEWELVAGQEERRSSGLHNEEGRSYGIKKL